MSQVATTTRFSSDRSRLRKHESHTQIMPPISTKCSTNCCNGVKHGSRISVGIAALGGPCAFGTEEDYCFYPAQNGGVGDHKAQ